MLLILLATILHTDLAHAKPKAKTQPIWTEHLKGEVYLIRGKRTQTIQSETPLKAGDTIQTSREGSITLRLSPMHTLRIASSTRIELSSEVHLKYGHIHARFDSPKSPEIKLPTALIKSNRAEFIAHVMRTEKEFNGQLAGSFPTLPSLDELKQLALSPDLYSQVDCVHGNLQVMTQDKDKIQLMTGDVIKIAGKTTGLTPLRPGLEEIQNLITTLFGTADAIPSVNSKGD